MRTAKIGPIVCPVETWNPVRDGNGREIRYIDLSSVDNETKTVSVAQTISADVAPSRARQLVRAGDILVSTVRPNLNGVAQVPESLDGATASTGFCVLRAAQDVDPGYLFHWVTGPEFVSSMVRRATGQSYPAVSDRIVCESEIPLPALDEQRRIAAILDQADALRRQRREALTLLDKLEQSIFDSVCGDPVSNSKGWPDDLELGDVAEIVSGITKGRKLGDRSTRRVPYLAVANVQDRYLALHAVKEIDATEAEIARYRLMPDDLLLTEGGDPDKLGRGALWAGELHEVIHQNHVFRVRLNSPDLSPVFLNWLVGSQRGKKYFLRAAKQTTGIASINMGQLKKFPLLLPPIEVQRSFESAIQATSAQKKIQRDALEQLGKLFSSIQYRAFRGEL